MKAVSALILGLCCGVATAQPVQVEDIKQLEFAHKVPMPRGMTLDRAWDSGVLANADPDAQVVWSTIIQSPQAAWSRIHFGGCQLSPGSLIRASSLKDGQVHTLDAAQLLEWNNATAYFNGSDILVELIAGPQTEANRLTITQVEIEIPALGPAGDPGICGICQTDGRVSSTQGGVGRTMPNGCTAAVYTPWGCTVSAGHCGGPNMQIIQFNVPQSNANCTIAMPPVDDQFPFIRSTGGGPFNPGSDWNVGVTGRNPSGQSVFQRYGIFLPLATARASQLQAVDVYGYGFNTACTLNQTLQRSPGSGIAAAVPSTQYYYTFGSDIREGNSGSPLMRQGRIIGVVTHCSENCPPNYATIIDLPVFAEVRASFCPCPADFNVDGIADFFDYLDFVDAFSAGALSADFNGDSIVDFFDYLDYVDAFSIGC